MSSDTIPFLGDLWWTATTATAAGLVVVCLVPRLVPRVAIETWLRILAVALGINWLLGHVPYLLDGSWQLATHLPLHLCGLSSALAVLVLWRPDQLASELLYYFGVAGGVHSLITPEFTNGIDPIALPQYYILHTSIIVVPLLVMRVRGFRPRRWSWVTAFLWIQVLAVSVGRFNVVIGGNYMYLAHRPEAANALIIGPWPWYILGFEVAALLHFVLLGAPFTLRSRAPEPESGERAELAEPVPIDS